MTLNAHHSLNLSGAARSGLRSRAPGRELPLRWEAGLNNHPSSSTPTELKGHDASTCSQSAPSKVSGVNSHTVLGSKHVCLLSSVHSCKLQKNDFRPFSHSSCVYTKPWSFPEVSCSMECSCPHHHPNPLHPACTIQGLHQPPSGLWDHWACRGQTHSLSAQVCMGDPLTYFSVRPGITQHQCSQSAPPPRIRDVYSL